MPKNKKSRNKKITIKKSHKSLFDDKYLQIFFIAAILLISSIVAANFQTTQNLRTNSIKVLGDNDENQKESKNEDEDEDQDEDKDEKEDEDQDEKESENSSSEDSNIIEDESEEKFKEETEIETLSGQKIKTKIEDDGTTKVEIETGSIKLKYKIENGLLTLKAENENGENLELEDDELLELKESINDELASENITLSSSKNKIKLTKNNITALSSYPLSIDADTKELIILTPNGQKIITILPDKAIQNLLATGIINEFNSEPQTSNTINKTSEPIELSVTEEEIVYKISGKKNYNLLGIIPISTPVTAIVSAENGETIEKKQSILSNIIDLISP